MYESEAVYFIQEPQGTKIARGQIEWALLLALKKGFRKNQKTWKRLLEQVPPQGE